MENATREPVPLPIPTSQKHVSAEKSQCNNRTNTNVHVNCTIRLWVCKSTAGMSNYIYSHRTLMLNIGAAFPQLAKSCRSDTAARIFQLNKTDNLKTIIKNLKWM